MKKLFIFFLFAISTFFLPSSAFANESSPSGSPYDSVIEVGKGTISLVDAAIDAATVNKGMTSKIADYLTKSSAWKMLSGRAQAFLSKNASKLGPLVKKLGWIANAVDLAPSLYNTGLSILKQDKTKFIESFRDSTLKVVGIVGGLAIGAVVTAALPLVVTTSGIGAVALVCGGAIVSTGLSMLADKVVKDNFSKNIESFASSVYESLVYNSIFSSILESGKGSSGSVKLDALQW